MTAMSTQTAVNGIPAPRLAGGQTSRVNYRTRMSIDDLYQSFDVSVSRLFT